MTDKWRVLLRYMDLEQVEVPIYYSSTPSGRCPLLKTLLSNACRMDCKYCPFRAGSGISRATWRADKLVNLTIDLYNSGQIRGLFLSSSLFSDPDLVVEKQLEIVERLRKRGFRGYIHLRLMPGVSKSLLYEVVDLVDRVGLNLEAPNKYSFSNIAPSKGDWFNDIYRKLETLAFIAKRKSGVSVDTQFIYWRKLGSDLDYLVLTDRLYRMGLKRVYYSPFKPIPRTPLGSESPESVSGVHRLYQASFLLRDYGYSLEDIKLALDNSNNLVAQDPKELIFRKTVTEKVDILEATYEELIRVPGVGPKTARLIIALRTKNKLDYRNLRKYIPRRQLIKISKYAKIPL